MFSWKRALPQETTASTDTPANSLKPSSVNGTSAARVLLIRKDRKSTRLNSSHSQISYAVFCLKKKKKTQLQFRHDPYRMRQIGLAIALQLEGGQKRRPAKMCYVVPTRSDTSRS